MDRLCVRCVRMSLRSRFSHTACSPIINRGFSSTPNQREESSTSPSSRPNAPRTDLARKPATPRVQQSGAPNHRNQGSRPPVEGQLLRRATSTPPQGTLLRRTSGPPQSGQLLRRRPDQQGRPGQFTPRGTSPSPNQTGRPGRPNQQQQGKRRRKPTDRARNAHDDADAPTEAELDEYIAKYVDTPANPTESIEYHPAPQTAPELQKDWPDTPLSSTGLTASLVQKMEFLAHRIPHGYQTPEQLAKHFQQGNFTRFESEEEKQKVLEIAKRLAQKRAEDLSKRKGEDITPLDMSLSDLSKSTEDKKLLVNDIVKGDVGEAEKQRMPFLDSIVRNLRNNETYGTAEMDRFMARVQSVMPASSANAGANRRPAQKSS